MARPGCVVLLLASIVLAGCVGGETAAVPTSASTAPAGNSDTGIRGTVVSAELAPIGGAVVQVADGTPVTTNEAGAFEVRGVNPGEQRILVQAIGYSSVLRKVLITEGTITDIQIMLEKLVVREPFIEIIVRDGFDICSYSIFAFVGTAPSPCPLGTPVNAHALNLPEGWEYFVIQNVWQSAESFWVSIAPPGTGCTTGNPCPGVEISRSPLRIDGAPDDPEVAKRYALDGKRTYSEGRQNLTISTLYAGYLREEINNTAPSACVAFWGNFGVAARLGCPLGFGYSTGIRFKQYASIFHWERPAKPGEYSAIPDN